MGKKSLLSRVITPPSILLLYSITLLILSTCDLKKEYIGDEPTTGLNLKTTTPDGEILSSTIFITECEDRDIIIKEGLSGTLTLIEPGTYDIKITTRDQTKWLDDITIVEFETYSRTITFPNGKILVHCEDEMGNILNVPVYIYRSGDYENPLNTGWSDEHLNLPPGTYTIEIYHKGESTLVENVEVKDGETSTIEEVL